MIHLSASILGNNKNTVCGLPRKEKGKIVNKCVALLNKVSCPDCIKWIEEQLDETVEKLDDFIE